ncbi:MAG: 2-dehydropantoate 2-reductase [Chromatiales bacterium]|nr:2-dehydropantoate 2-reductase [Chromatiales bacterium]
MRIAIFGAGGVGGYFGGRLAQAGHEVTFIARGAHLEAMRRDGLRVASIAGDFTVSPVRASDDPATVGPVDAVLVAVKTWQVPDAARAMRPLVGPDTVVVPLLNGVEAPSQLAAVLGDGPVLGGLCAILAYVTGPGQVRHAGIDPLITLGELDNRPSERAARLCAAIDGCEGVSARIPDDIHVALWQKFLFITAMSGVGAVTRAPIGITREQPETRRMLEQVMEEVRAVAAARGVALPADVASRTMRAVDKLPPGGTASMQRDVIDGRPSELDAQTGAVVRLGAESGVPTPVNALLHAALLAQERRARGEVTF